MGRLDGRNALITGGARGIGFATAKAFVREGALVAICDIMGDSVQKSAKELAAFGREGAAYQLDVTKREDVDRVIEDFAKRVGGKLDILINNAGITRDSLLVRMTDAAWEEVMHINLYGTFYCTRAAVKVMMKRKYGRIVNLASVAAFGNAGQANYSASKGGVISFTKTIAREVASRNITVNAIAPGFIKTALTEQMPEAAKKAVLDAIPMKRFGVPEDIAGAILYFVSEEAGYVTGQILRVDGGLPL